jgi:uncharacterized RDD family membrane protein YckC
VEQLDTLHLVETPEGIDLQSELAGPVVRALAYLIDILIRSLILTLLSIVLAFAGVAGVGGILIVSFLLEWFYPVWFEVYRNGQTPGKKYMGIAVVNDDLTPITLSSSIIRNLLRFVDFLPFGYLAGLTTMVLTRRFQRLGDLAASSLVIYRNPTREHSALRDETPQPPPVPLSVEDQIAIIAFTERHQELSAARQEELADILSEITHKRGDKNIRYLRSIGNWLLGVR